MIMDNNILAAPYQWQKNVFEWFRDSGVKMLENGMDIRLLTEEKAGWIKDLKLPNGVRFAFDNMDDEPYVRRGIDLLKATGMNPHMLVFYVLTNYNSTIEQDIYRCELLRSLNVNAYVMIYDKPKAPAIVRKLQRWANIKYVYWASHFKDYERLTIGERIIVQGCK
jgi:hypothetical protein